jgi:hypothetical protein
MSAGNFSERKNQRDQCGASRQRTGQKRDRHIPARQPLTHNAGPHHCREQP